MLGLYLSEWFFFFLFFFCIALQFCPAVSLEWGLQTVFLTFQRQKTSMPKMVRPRHKLNPMIICATTGGSFLLLCASSFTCKDAEVKGQPVLKNKTNPNSSGISKIKKNWVQCFYPISYETLLLLSTQLNRKSSVLDTRLKWLLLTRNWHPEGEWIDSLWASTISNITICFVEYDLFCVSQCQKYSSIEYGIGLDRINDIFNLLRPILAFFSFYIIIHYIMLSVSK